MNVGLAFENDPSSFIYFDVGSTNSSDWNIKTIDIGSYADKKFL